ncbi:MAG: response regulator transcription factor [Chloroflexi bacterium]|nr:response regulator transcription factor [Chloroflexota bacterium]
MRILLADDHAVVRRGLEMVLGLEKDFEIVGDARNGTQAVARVVDLHPDLVLMDLKMPGLEGSAATRQIKRALPDVKVLILTGVEVDEEILGALDAGADGYILKDVSPEELIHAIRVVGAGEAYLQPSVTKRVIQKMRGAPARVAAPPPAHPALTGRECEVLHLMATSATNREIAAQLSVSEETVRSHSKSILAKLDQPNRAQAVLAALREGLVTLD